MSSTDHGSTDHASTDDSGTDHGTPGDDRPGHDRPGDERPGDDPPGARTVERAFRTALYDTADTALDTGASLLAADRAADAELNRRGTEFVATAWRRGWQPADLVRFVRRELDDLHVGLVAQLIRTQSRDDRARGRRWAAQLEELSADTAPPPATDRFSHATTVLELYRLLLRLPALEPLQEPEAHRQSRPGSHPRMLTRIRALLAKAEATGFPQEAEALTAKAQELMARHSVDEALLDAQAPSPDAPGACRIGVEPPYEQAKAVLLGAVADANHCRAVWNESFAFSTVVGFEADLEAVELLYTSLLVQAQSAMAKAEAAQRAGGRKRTKTFRQSFLAAYAHRIGTRLGEVTAAAETQVTDELLPVLASREVAVTAATDRMFPATVSTRLRGVTDEAGWNEGSEAADRARMRSRPRLP
ncbi:aromatic acid decarboxylase [Streptomyces maremycinicus]|nr:aromatic acid decarboxylase [Streptomyces sp. B9173]